MRKQCILTLKSESNSVKIVKSVNGTYKKTYYEIMSNRRRICRPFGYDTLTESVEVALSIVLPEMYENQGGCKK